MCCEPTIVPFNGATLSIPWGATEIAKHGQVPDVQVLIKEGSEYVVSEFIEAKFTGTSIDFDFGGSQVGIIKII
jgi:uncharacterized protein YlzI (FlbEa/FlbD family)